MPQVPLPDSVRRASGLSAKAVTVHADGKRFDVKDADAAPEQPTMADVMLAMIRGEQVRDRAAIDALTEQVKVLASKVEELTGSNVKLVADNSQILAAVAALDKTMRLPVQPVFNDKGKTIGAIRVEKLAK